MVYSLEWRLAKADAEGAIAVHRVVKKVPLVNARLDKVYFVENGRLICHELYEDISTRALKNGQKYSFLSAPPPLLGFGFIPLFSLSTLLFYGVDYLFDDKFPNYGIVLGTFIGSGCSAIHTYLKLKDDRTAWHKYKSLEKIKKN